MTRRSVGCAQWGNPINSISAIVAPLSCTLVRGALVLVTPPRPAGLSGLLRPFLPDVGPFAPTLTKVLLPVLLHFGKSIFVPITKS